MNPESNTPEPSTAIVERVIVKAVTLGDQLPEIGSYCWVKEKPEPVKGKRKGRKKIQDDDEPEEKKDPRGELMCVAEIASNHVRFQSIGGENWHSISQIAHDDLPDLVKPEPRWREIIMERMEETRRLMEEAAKSLYDSAVNKGALPDPNAEPRPETVEGCMMPAIRVSDPVKQKIDLLAVKEAIPRVTEEIGNLAKEYAAQCKGLILPEKMRLEEMTRKLKIVNEKIFTLEVYAGLQETVAQIADGQPASPDTKIGIRQAMLYMDEETLMDYDRGGMDFRSLERFDEWVCRPENLDRVLPERRGIVAWRIRRHPKDYGPCKDIWDALEKQAMHQANMETYLLIRNGERVYRIASAVDFSPRLIPLRDEFEGGFKEVKKGWFGEQDTERTITPRDFEYDEHREKLLEHMKGYNRIVILIQGLLDRSEVFHPHAPINLANAHDMDAWLHFVRDEEDGLELPFEHYEEFRARLAKLVVEGSVIWHNYRDPKKRHYRENNVPSIITVKRVRLGRSSDVIPPQKRNDHGYRGGVYYDGGRPAEECVGIPGVEVEYPRYNESRNFYKLEPKEAAQVIRLWIPLEKIFNISAYHAGSYRRFVLDRTAKQSYRKWAPALFAAEDYLNSKKPKNSDSEE